MFKPQVYIFLILSSLSETQLAGLTNEEEMQAQRWIKALSNPLLGNQEKIAFAEAVIASSKAVQDKVNESLKIIFWEKDELAWKKEQKRKKEERKEKKKEDQRKEDKRKEEEKRSNKKTQPNQKKNKKKK